MRNCMVFYGLEEILPLFHFLYRNTTLSPQMTRPEQGGKKLTKQIFFPLKVTNLFFYPLLFSNFKFKRMSKWLS